MENDQHDIEEVQALLTKHDFATRNFIYMSEPMGNRGLEDMYWKELRKYEQQLEDILSDSIPEYVWDSEDETVVAKKMEVFRTLEDSLRELFQIIRDRYYARDSISRHYGLKALLRSERTILDLYENVDWTLAKTEEPAILNE